MLAIEIPLLTLALAGIAAFAWRIVRVAWRSLRASRARMDAAGERLRELLDKESQKARLLRLDSVSPDPDGLGLLPPTPGDDCATWADHLFARCAGGGAQLYYEDQRGHWTACVPLFEGGPVVAFALDVTDRGRAFEALLAALDIVVVNAPPVVDAEHTPSGACVRFDAGAGRWQAFEPCDACGGGWMNTTFDTLDHEPLARLSAGRVRAVHDHAQCAACTR